MATSASGAAETSRIPAGVPALRAGQGHSFLWRRLQSITGIFPVGAFLVEHFISNAFATNGSTTAQHAAAYNKQVAFLTGMPFVLALEICFIYIPILYHALYGFWIWYRGEGNVGAYPWVGNWMYTLQRWTGIVTFAYIVYHTYTMRFTGVHILTNSEAAFWKVQQAFQSPWVVAFYIVGVIAASWHFAYGIWLFCAKWGISQGVGARWKLGYVCVVIGAAFIVMGIASALAFLGPMVPEPALQEHARALMMR